MGQLKELQADLREILFIGSNKKASKFWKEGLPKRLQVYRNTVHGNAYDTLDSDFKLTKKQFSGDEWLSLSEKFFSRNSPDHWELNNCIVSFPKFLKSQKVKPFLVELAEYELADLSTFISTEVVKKGGQKTNPTVAIRVFDHQIFDWTLEECPADSPPGPSGEVLVFYRDSKHNGHVRRGDPLELLLIDHFKKDGATLKDVESVRKKILPGNKVPLSRVLEVLKRLDVIL